MLLKPLLLVALVSMFCHAAPRSDADIANLIYNNVILGDYGEAIEMTRDLNNRGQSGYINQVVNRLVDNGQRNSVVYAYKLYHGGDDSIVKRNFPIEFRMLVSGAQVKLINKRDNLAIKLGWDLDRDGDATAYGDGKDKTSERISWNFLPLIDNNRVYFRLLNAQRGRFLKVAIRADSAGDRKAYGSTNSDSNRHQFYLIPVRWQSQVLFYIFNREYDHSLKLGRDVDGDGDRQVWSHNGYVLDNPAFFAWHIVPF